MCMVRTLPDCNHVERLRWTQSLGLWQIERYTNCQCIVVVDWWSYCKIFSSYVKKMKSTASAGTEATFFVQIRCDAVCRHMCPDAFADDIMSNAPCSRTHRLLRTKRKCTTWCRQQKRRDSCIKHRFPLLLKLSIAGHAIFNFHARNTLIRCDTIAEFNVDSKAKYSA